MNIWLVCGLPGSGKTTFAKRFAEDRNAIIFDDIGIAAITKLQEALSGCQDCIVVDVNFCKAEIRKIAVQKIREMCHTDVSISWIFFENAPDKCRANIVRRQAAGDNRKVEESIRYLSKIYKVPIGHAALKVWGPEEIYETNNTTATV